MPAATDTLHPVEDRRHRRVRSTVRRADRRASRKVWSALWPKLLAVALFIGVWQMLVWTGWKPEYALPSPFTVFERVLAPTRARSWEATPDDAARVRSSGYALALVDRCRRRARRVPVSGPALGRRLDDHRPADDAVDRVVPGRDRAVRAERDGDPVRRRARRGTVDRQRPHQRRRQHPADPAARRPRARRTRASRRSATSCSRPRCRRSSAA